jgi:hypothetical protein
VDQELTDLPRGAGIAPHMLTSEKYVFPRGFALLPINTVWRAFDSLTALPPFCSLDATEDATEHDA